MPFVWEIIIWIINKIRKFNYKNKKMRDKSAALTFIIYLSYFQKGKIKKKKKSIINMILKTQMDWGGKKNIKILIWKELMKKKEWIEMKNKKRGAKDGARRLYEGHYANGTTGVPGLYQSSPVQQQLCVCLWWIGRTTMVCPGHNM